MKAQQAAVYSASWTTAAVINRGSAALRLVPANSKLQEEGYRMLDSDEQQDELLTKI